MECRCRRRAVRTKAETTRAVHSSVEQGFFEKQSPSSRVKAEIVACYFDIWGRIITRAPRVEKIVYMDLFAGPGRYEDGSESTPLMVLRRALRDEGLRAKLVTIFNDRNRAHIRRLRHCIAELPGIESLRYAPVLLDQEIGQRQAKQLAATKLAPTLLFADPCGLKGLSRELIAAVLKGFGSECVFFFNYEALNRCISAPEAGTVVEDLLGPDESASLQRALGALRPREREERIVSALERSLGRIKGRYVLRFRFKKSRNRTSHYLVFATKHQLGYGKMKEIMAARSSSAEDGVASFEFDPTSVGQPALRYEYRRLDRLGHEIAEAFAGQTLTVEDVYERHNVGTPYILTNYKAAVLRLEQASLVTADPPAAERRKDATGAPTLGDSVKIAFPKL